MLNGAVAPILNLVIKIKNGSVEEITWKNECIQPPCAFTDCKANTHLNPYNITQAPITDKNCYIRTCGSNGNCDTKVYVTWVGADKKERDSTSDNFRITNFKDYSILTYVDKAMGLATLTK